MPVKRDKIALLEKIELPKNITGALVYIHQLLGKYIAHHEELAASLGWQCLAENEERYVKERIFELKQDIFKICKKQDFYASQLWDYILKCRIKMWHVHGISIGYDSTRRHAARTLNEFYHKNATVPADAPTDFSLRMLPSEVSKKYPLLKRPAGPQQVFRPHTSNSISTDSVDALLGSVPDKAPALVSSVDKAAVVVPPVLEYLGICTHAQFAERQKSLMALRSARKIARSTRSQVAKRMYSTKRNHQ